jgi:hypothetical protein
MSDYLPIYDDADAAFTLTLSGTVTGGQLVTWAGAVAGTASTTVAGVAGQDGVSGDKITVWGPTSTAAPPPAPSPSATRCAPAPPACPRLGGGTDAVASFIGRAMTAATATASVSYLRRLRPEDTHG